MVAAASVLSQHSGEYIPHPGQADGLVIVLVLWIQSECRPHSLDDFPRGLTTPGAPGPNVTHFLPLLFGSFYYNMPSPLCQGGELSSYTITDSPV